VVPGYDANFAGQSVRGRFVTTLHSVNHGCIRLARLSVAEEVRARSLPGSEM
jgi:hypothetical protein